jgi:exopolyphosphatase/guanosine-5'-triphosphate,3'-diphosphate pyrophosphatase
MTRVGAVDIGTNSVRLLVAEVHGVGRDAKLETLDRRMRITRLGQGVDATGALALDDISRTTAVLREYRSALDEYGVTNVRATATSAARDSSNRDDLFDPAERALGVRPELLSGDEEARLSFLGATASLGVAGEPAPYLVVDIGGGSTEFVLGSDAPEGVISIDIGCVRITEQFLHSDPPAPERQKQTTWKEFAFPRSSRRFSMFLSLSRGRIGNSTMTVEPLPNSLSHRTCPFIAPTILFTMDRPRP